MRASPPTRCGRGRRSRPPRCANLLGGEDAVGRSRTPEIMADAAHAILVRDSRACTGNFFIDEDVLREEGVTDLEQYRVEPGGQPLEADLFLDPLEGSA